MRPHCVPAFAKRSEQKHRFGRKASGAEIALVGNPNTGKSCLFSYLTGISAVISNYAGTTVDILEGKCNLDGKTVKVVDLPGTYSLGSATEEERVTSDYIIEKKPKVIINVLDATVLERNLYLTLQLLELKVPMIVALNFYEELEDKGITVDHDKLSKILGVPVVPIDALRGAGIKEVANKCSEMIDSKVDLNFHNVKYDDHIEKAIKKIAPLVLRKDIQKRAASIALLEGNNERWEELKRENSGKVKNVKKIIASLSKEHPLSTEISRERHGQAAIIANQLTKRKEVKKKFKDWLDRFTTEPLTGVLSMIVIMGIIFSALFYFGNYLSTLLGDMFNRFIITPLNPFLAAIPSNLARDIIIWSLDGINAGLQIALPYIAVFYIMLAFLEDSGYLPRMAYILDRTMHRLHLHGKAIVPMMLGFGCSVPAVLATRILPSKKERILTAILISLIPCSARTAVILGSVGKFIGIRYALLIYGIILLIIFLVGIILGRMLPGESEGLILEMPDYRIPYLKNVFQKTWLRVKDFITIAFPLIVVGSVVLGVLKFYGLLELITKPFEPVISGWLMLPAVTGVTLIYGILRKELALELLFVLGGSSMLLSFMTPLQIFVFALVVALYFPCLGTFAVLKHEFGWRISSLIAFFTIALSIVVGGLVGRLFVWVGVL